MQRRAGIENPLLKMLLHPATLATLAAGGVGAITAKTLGKKVGGLARGLRGIRKSHDDMPQNRLQFFRNLAGVSHQPHDIEPYSATTQEILNRIGTQRATARPLSDELSNVFDPGHMHSADIQYPQEREMLEAIGVLQNRMRKAGENVRGSHSAIDFPTPGIGRFTQYQDRPMRYVLTRDIPMWDFDMPSPFHSSGQVLNRSVADAIESLRRHGAGSGTLYRTPGGARYIDKQIRATPNEMHNAGGIPDRIDPYYEGIIAGQQKINARASERQLDILDNAARGDAVRTAHGIDKGLLETLLGTEWPMRGAYAARLSPKYKRSKDYIAQPIMEMGSSVNPHTSKLVNRYHDATTSLAMRRPENVEAFASDVAKDLGSLDRRDREAVKRFMAARHGIPLSLAAILAGGSLAANTRET